MKFPLRPRPTCAGATLHHTLTALGVTDVDTWFVPKGANIHTTDATEALSAFKADALIVLDQGSRGGPPILPGVPTLILDHHQSTVFPDEAQASSMAVRIESREAGAGGEGRGGGMECHEAAYCIEIWLPFYKSGMLERNLTCMLWLVGCAYACSNCHIVPICIPWLCDSHSIQPCHIGSALCWQWHIQLIISSLDACLHSGLFIN